MSAIRETEPDPAATPLEAVAVERLVASCAVETTDYFQTGAGDGRYGHQLFRRALVDGDPAAWEAVVRLYGPLLARWARANRLFAHSGEAAEALVNEALVRLWRQVGPADFARFATLASLLAYLRCVIDRLVIDHARAQTREQRRAEALGQALAGRTPVLVGARALERVQAGEVWALVRRHCQGEQEARLAYGTLVLGLPPRELLAADPTTFGSVALINAGLANLRRRLRRSAALRQHYRASGGD